VSGWNLVIAAIALWNILFTERADDHLRTRDVAAPDALLAHLSLMGWATSASRATISGPQPSPMVEPDPWTIQPISFIAPRSRRSWFVPHGVL
jgi:hypothetical protein